jgi:hypothetical protein
MPAPKISRISGGKHPTIAMSLKITFKAAYLARFATSDNGFTARLSNPAVNSTC